jgi:cell division protein FtsB
MSDHSHFEELAALEAGGFLSDEELIELREHTEACDECREVEEEFNSLVHFGLPLTVGPVREFMDKAKTRPDDNMRLRFLRRGRLEGIAFSPDVNEPTRHHARRIGFFAASGAALITAVVVISMFHGASRPDSRRSSQAQQQIDQLKQENAALTANLSRSSESLEADQREIQNLHIQLGNVSTTAENLRRTGQQARGDAERASSLNAQSQDESRNNEKLLAQAKDEEAHANQLRNNDIASLVDQQARITELSDKLRVASATLDLERQLTAEGKNIGELMAARQLHVIDVRDTDPNGKPGKAFGRVILTEGKSLTFYAFDLNENKGADAKRSFQVWAAPDAGANSARSLGFLHVDAKAQGRWVLKVDDPELVKKLNSVYVTSEPAAGSKQASGQKMLYAYLGQANHP